MTGNQVHIYSAGTPYLAELIGQMLAEYEIQSFIVNKQDSVYKFGEIELYVNRDQVIRAKKLIAEFESR
ncbi:MAG: DUF2007 domain-containing protein [Bacteroidetes bacterium]|nr:DUF2007 domain-containing protein [Bacteroidota bacterium]